MQYSIKITARYRRDIKRLRKSKQYDLQKLDVIIDLLIARKPLPVQCRDHALTGNLKEYRECHIEHGWLLVYRWYDDVLVLELSQTGSHAQLFRK